MNNGRQRRTQNGFSLIELMLALGLGVIVTAGIVQLFVGNNQTYNLLTGQARMQESARYAIDFIGRSARAAGYFGCDPEPAKIYRTLNGAWNQIFEMNITVPMEAFDGTVNGNQVTSWTPSLTPLPRQIGGASVNTFINGNGIDISALVPLTDILVFRHVAIPGERINQFISPTGDPVVEDDGDMQLAVNDFAVIADCEQAALFRISQINMGVGEATLMRVTGGGTFDNAVGAPLSEQGVPFGNAVDSQGATVGRAVTEIYFVALGNGLNNRGVQPSSLWRKTTTQAPVELIQGIEDLQVLFGIDTNGDGMANRYVPAGGVGLNPVRAMRVAITSNSVDAVDGDQLLRRTFVQTIAMRN